MIKFPVIHLFSAAFMFLMQPVICVANEKLLETSISTRVEHNDNIFLATSPNSVSSFSIIPSVTGIIKEQNWQVDLGARLNLNEYSDHTLDSNEQLFNLNGQYSAERNIFSIGVGHDITSSLSSTSSDFGISTQRVERKTQSITPQFTRLLTERMILTMSYTYSDTDYRDNDDDRFVASYTESATAALRYNLTERDQVSVNLQAVDYTRKDDLGDIQIISLNVATDHKFSDNLSLDLAIGKSDRDSTNLQTTALDFFGTTILVPQEFNTKTDGTTLNLGIHQVLESGSISARLSRNSTTNSFGGVNETDKFVLTYLERLSSLWQYSISARYEDISSITIATTSTDREAAFIEARTRYSISRDWYINLAYRYGQRKFTNTSTNDNTPHSNRLRFDLTYNFPSLTTF